MGQEVVLVGIRVAQYLLGQGSERISEMIGESRLIWVWDFASGDAGFRRNLRFWVPELRASPEGRPHADSAEVIRKVIGPTPGGRQRSALMETRWSISPQLVKSLVDDDELEGPILGHTRFLPKRSMEEFLLRRLVR